MKAIAITLLILAAVIYGGYRLIKHIERALDREHY